MRRKQTVETMLRRKLGREEADRLLATIDTMVARRAKAEAIEAKVTRQLEKVIEQQATQAIRIVSADPHVSAKGVQAVRPVIRRISVSPSLREIAHVKSDRAVVRRHRR